MASRHVGRFSTSLTIPSPPILLALRALSIPAIPRWGAAFGASFLTPDFAAGNPLIGSGSERVMQVGLKISF